jgi:ABC-type maltose transport system permease subunit
MLHNPANFTLPVGVALLIGRAGAYSWGVVNAAGVLIMIPVLIMFSIIQRHLIAGFSVGAIKG